MFNVDSCQLPVDHISGSLSAPVWYGSIVSGVCVCVCEGRSIQQFITMLILVYECF